MIETRPADTVPVMASIARALLVVLPDPALAFRLAQDRMAAALAGFGFSDIVRLPDGPTLTRGAVYEAIDALLERVGPDDPCVFYYFGHGGRVRFSDLATSRPQVFNYLSCSKEAGEFEALLDVSLSARLTRLARACGNLTTILDACHSATIVRSGDAKARVAPAWVRDELAVLHEFELPPESHPEVVRLAGATPLSRAETGRGEHRGLGLLTLHLCEELSLLGSRRESVSWDALAHRLRGRIFTTARSEYQWPVLAGPRERRLFDSVALPLPRTVGFVGTSSRTGWIWAGSLQGIEVGDRWLVADLYDRVSGEGTVVEIGINRAKLALDRDAVEFGHARLVGVAQPMPVQLDREVHDSLAERVACSAWMRAVDEVGQARLTLERDDLIVSDSSGRWSDARLLAAEPGNHAAIELLEDRARSHRLLATVPSSALPPIELTWHHEAGSNTTRLVAGTRITLRLDCSDTSPNSWFVQVVFIDAIGRPWLLAPSQPEGMEIRRGESGWIGARLGTRPGVTLGWPSPAMADEALCTFVLLACGRPLQLGHLVRPHEDHDSVARALNLRPEPSRTRGPAEPMLTARAGVRRYDIMMVRE